MKTILITGAYGFVGTNLVNYLKNSYTLWALDVRQQKEGLYSRYFSWDDLGSIPFDEVDTIIHLAGKAHDVKGTSEAQIYFDINTGLTQKVFDRFLSSDSKKFIFFSSVKAAADYVPGDILTEDIIPHPVGPYGESKIKAEEYIQSKDWNDKKVYIFRPCMIHGPGNKGNLNLLYSFINKGIPYPLGSFKNKRSFTSVENLCYIIDAVAKANVESGIYNIADDIPLSTNELIGLICLGLERKPRIWNMPKKTINMVAKIGNVLHLPLNTARLDKLTENYIVDNTKIKSALGIKDLPVTSSDGIIKTIKSFKNN
ncbi:nucleoside-diphosphate-sugar epimerase [Dysgonomonas sp. PFB1-18]|uniref:NAD-dependent epimerase/dehydratase family protein n=1 Tax=unclassified Dysgonomonas TaxID=2630389 RepID=UPI002476B8FF|nr:MULTISPECIES: NAD-dependent epimerase/dehydratase family protein [unclassified Dysgonomonas]MDH6307765.1 nucleoside-diphosphate-sugar epimerase [Dysgonomonas sp. PF1-14]MDH6337683.1 nucleoside-diphosphate-sugar epimerase [Dysgonomonas sp. PF1-16]MDH6378907.1 nucleoside-diphosphate-sugar epimerase [Dysgonomonas sp. PFB1-18]MDH6396542.1 nucleoside-diphosphate-sugar epimerase [Dysgonomonas sp. PF1-23]